MRHGKFRAVLAALSVVGCSASEPMEDMVGYVPPTSLPAQPKRTLVADPQDRVWAELTSFLETSDFQIDHVDREKNLLVARYSGNPEPFIDCGSIVTHQNGSLGQIAGSAPAVALNYTIDDSPVVLNRGLNLDSRIIIRLAGQPQGTVIKTDTTYVVTKTVDVADPSGAVREGSRETISFEAGGRGEFSKGTACQPNGSLDLAVLQSLPNIVGSDEIDRAELSEDSLETADLAPLDEDVVAARPEPTPPQAAVDPPNTIEDQANLEGLDAATVPSPEPDPGADDWVLPDQGLPTAALPGPDPAAPSNDPPAEAGETTALSPPDPAQPLLPPAGPDDLESQRRIAPGFDGQQDAPAPGETAAVIPNSPRSSETVGNGSSSASIVDDTTRKLLESLNCSGEEWHFCDLVELTTPYRKRNIDQLFGLTINTTESFTSQIVGRDVKLDILFPSFPSHLHIAYARRDGLVEHVMSSSEVWPADLTHQLAGTDKKIPGPEGLAMIIAIASDQPLFPSPPDSAEDATVYLGRLKQRLAELEASNPDGPVAASQLLIYVENADS
ncbi:MAG: hypothetical protein ACR2RA_20320 [Geminicoccaceae bacterium]